MRFIVVGLALAMVAMAGCANEDPATQGNDDDLPGAVQENATVPAPLQFSGTLRSVAAPTGDTTGCGPDGSGCATHEFSIDDTFWVTITLASNDGMVTGTTASVIWGSDYDMTLRDGSGNELATSTNPGDEDDIITMRLGPGDYQVDILSWNDQDGEYVLDIEFAKA